MDKKIQTLESKQRETVLRISQAVSRTLDLKEILEMACKMTAQALKADRCSIGLLSSKDIYNIVHTYRKKSSYPSIAGAKFILTKYPNIAPSLMKRKAVHLFNHKKINLSLKEKELFKQLNMKVFLAVPIFADRKPLGAFHLSRVEESFPFSSSDIKLCQTIANQVGIAIRNATLLKDLKDKYNQQNLTLNISRSLFKTLNLQELFNLITQKTCEALRMDRCTISTFDPRQKQGVIRSIYLSREAGAFGNGKRDSAYLGRKYTISDFPYIYKLLQKRKVFATEDIFSTPLTFRARKYYKEIRVKSTLILPLFSHGKISGILQVSSIKDYHLFTDSEIKLCQTIANLASLAIENAKLMQDIQDNNIKIEQQANALEKQFKEQSILLEISKALSQTLDLNKLFEITTKKTADLLEIDRCGVVLVDEIKGAAFFVSIYADGRHQPPEESIRGSIEDFPVIFSHLKNKHRFHTIDISQSALSSKEKKIFKAKGTKSLLVVPLAPIGKFQGLLALSTVKKQRKFTGPEIKLCQAIANQLSVATENANLVQEVKNKSIKIEEQTNILEKQFREQSILLQISKALSKTLDLKRLFEIVTKKTANLLGVDRTHITLLDEKRGVSTFHKVYSEGKFLDEWEGVQRRRDDFSVLYNQLKKGLIFCTSDVSRSVLSPKEKNYFKKECIKSFLAIPFSLEGKLRGVLTLSTLKEHHQFTKSEIKLCQAITNQLSVAVENAHLMELTKDHSKQLEKVALKIINAQENERKNLAGKLHDVIAQDLTAIHFDLKMCQKVPPERCDQIKTKLKQSEELVGQSLENLRNLTSDLRPPVLDHFGLPSAIHWYVDNFKRRTNLKIDLKVPKFSCKHPPEFETAIYRIIQESLTNVAKHSQATRVLISLYQKGNTSRITVKDNGIGFEPDKSSLNRGFGLLRLKENTELLGGKFKIISKKGRGTKLSITLPCEGGVEL